MEIRRPGVRIIPYESIQCVLVLSWCVVCACCLFISAIRATVSREVRGARIMCFLLSLLDWKLLLVEIQFT